VGGLECDGGHLCFCDAGRVLDDLDDWKCVSMSGLVRIGGLSEAQFWAVSIRSVFLHIVLRLLH
jgi:hypothetical protein